VRSNTVIKAKSLEVKLGSVEKGQLEVTFGDCNIEVGAAAAEEESTTAWGSEDSDKSKQQPWVSAPATYAEADVATPSSTSTPVGRSTWKSSRTLEASGAASDDARKTTLR
jgi:hypothetical protein